MSTLMRGAGEGRPGAVVSPIRQAATQNMLQTTCNILAYTCADPVYRVFVASLVSVCVKSDREKRNADHSCFQG